MSATNRIGNRTRARILQLIERRPGIHKSEICRELGLGWGTLTYQLKVLDRNRKIHLHIQGRSLHAYPRSMPKQRVEWMATLAGPTLTLLEALKTHPGARITDLRDRTGHCRKFIRARLEQLHEEGLVVRDDEYQAKYFAVDADE